MNQGMWRSLSVVAMGLLLTVILAACGSPSDKVPATVTREDVAGAPPTRTATTEAPPTTAASPGAAGTPGGEQPGGASFDITLVDLAFEPNDLTIPSDTDVTVNLHNKGNLPHNFSIPSQNISVDVGAGETQTTTLNLPAGKYDFDCDVPGHKEAGMVGTITADPSAAAGGSGGGAGTPAASGGDQPAAGSGGVTVDMVELSFQPDSFEIPANTATTVTLHNKGALPHNFSIPSQNISVDVNAGDTQTVELTLPAGEYDFDCDVPGHKEAGMVGKITVK